MLNSLTQRFQQLFPQEVKLFPWEVVNKLSFILETRVRSSIEGYVLREGVAVHHTAIVETNATIKGPAIIGPGSFIAGNAYLRGPVFIDENVRIGAGCEIKHSIIFSDSAIAHFNYIGNSIIGSHVNFEAGSIAANHYNEREHKLISVIYQSTIYSTGSEKFGALVGDGSKIGANAVLSPGTILPQHSIVRRLELIEQLKE